jgi:hypothetical protein
MAEVAIKKAAPKRIDNVLSFPFASFSAVLVFPVTVPFSLGMTSHLQKR